MSVVGITSRGNEEQAKFIEEMFDKEKKIIFVEGNAGTGKTFITLATALELVNKGNYNRIVFSRDLVQVGEAMGFLPGTAGEKMDPFMMCLEDALDAIERIGGVITKSEAKYYIDVEPICFIRGRSLDKTILIVDEAQNLDLTTIRTVLTRIGDNCKVILMGDKKQIDKRGQKYGHCDFERAMNALSEQDFVSHLEFIKSERSSICAKIDDILSALD